MRGCGAAGLASRRAWLLTAARFGPHFAAVPPTPPCSESLPVLAAVPLHRFALRRAGLPRPFRLSTVGATLRVFGATIAARAAAAQGPAPPPVPGPLPYQQILSASPLFIPLGNFSAEYERRLGVRRITVAVNGTYNATSQLYPRKDRWVQGRLMYYPSGTALDGVAVGLTVGAHRAERRYGEDPARVRTSDAGATLGAMATYNYFYGPQRRFFVGPGFGVKRVLKNLAADSPLSQTYFEGRAALGIAF